MSKIRETITALTAGENPGAVHINRKEREPITDERLTLILKHISRDVIIAAGTILILYADVKKLAVLAIFTVVFSLIYFGFRD